jgi:restriction system protein
MSNLNRSYFLVRLGRQGIYVESCISGNFIGVDYNIPQDLTPDLTDEWRGFNKKFIPLWLNFNSNKNKTKVAAGLACASLWTVSKGIKRGDIVICPDFRSVRYHFGEISGDYYYVPGESLPHRRSVNWSSSFIERSDMSNALRNSTGCIGTVAELTKHAEEIERLIGSDSKHKLLSTDETMEDLSAFAMEKHLEDFLIQNWSQTDFGKEYDIFEEDGEIVGRQYPTDTGPVDILAVKKDKSELLIIELKKGRASDAAVGQILRYMGYAIQELSEPNQKVRGVIIALEDDQRIRRALIPTSNIDFYRYQISFKLLKT